MYSNDILNFQESTTILSACTKKSGNLLNAPHIYIYIYIRVLVVCENAINHVQDLISCCHVHLLPREPLHHRHVCNIYYIGLHIRYLLIKIIQVNITKMTKSSSENHLHSLHSNGLGYIQLCTCEILLFLLWVLGHTN